MSAQSTRGRDVVCHSARFAIAAAPEMRRVRNVLWVLHRGTLGTHIGVLWVLTPWYSE